MHVGNPKLKQLPKQGWRLTSKAALPLLSTSSCHLRLRALLCHARPQPGKSRVARVGCRGVAHCWRPRVGGRRGTGSHLCWIPSLLCLADQSDENVTVFLNFAPRGAVRGAATPPERSGKLRLPVLQTGTVWSVRRYAEFRRRGSPQRGPRLPHWLGALAPGLCRPSVLLLP